MIQITFMPFNMKEMVEEGTTMLAAAAKAGIMIDGSCAGAGTCGKCKVKVLSGTVGELDEAELRTLTAEEQSEGYRLACRLVVREDMQVHVPDVHGSSQRKKKMTRLPEDFQTECNVKKYVIEVEKPELSDQSSDVDRLLRALKKKEGELAAADMEYPAATIEPALLNRIPELLKEKDGQLTAAVRRGKIFALEAGDTSTRCFGVAFDIGTTTVVGMLWDMEKAELLDVLARTNPQSTYGSDVISRINYSSESEEKLLEMKEKVRDCFNEMIGVFCEEWKLRPEEIYEATVVGNTTMSHLFLGVTPLSLSMAPFAPVFCDGVELLGSELGISMNQLGKLYLLPNIAGHVGSDIVGVMLTTRIARKSGVHLAIDVGTNGEILLSRDGEVLTCSTAAGPAFEGAAIFQGMRAAKGAIEGVMIRDGQIELKVIEDVAPIGICGSGLIDVMAQMLDAGVMDFKGRLLARDAAESGGKVHPELLPRLREGESGREFVLAFRESGGDIVITQKDIREVQLAKGAIYGGIIILLQTFGMGADALDEILLAGAFGNYINKESALRIGLFPNVGLDKIISVGNAAGAGACMALLSKTERQNSAEQSRAVRHVELAGHPDFEMEYIKAMNFPKK